MKARLEDAERQLVAYAASNQLVTLQPSTGGSAEATASNSLTAANLVAMNNALAQAKQDRIRAEQRWRQAADTSAANLPEVIQNSTVQSLRGTRAQLFAQYQQKLHFGMAALLGSTAYQAALSRTRP